MKKKEAEKNIAQQISEIAQNIWFLGLGSVGKTLDESQSQWEKANHELTRLYHELVKNGKKVETDLQKKLHANKEKTNSLRERQMEKVKGAMKIGNNINEKVESVSEKLDVIIEAMKNQKKAA
jgi:predicted  nucleic acid-binding Zn-ribbon protein